jgi:tetratricopeptide (TPR) repeat protein
MDMDVLAVYPHAHYLGRLLEGYATLPDGSRKELIRIPDWDVNWQAVFRYRSPVFLPKGTVVSMRFHYDNSDGNPRNPNHPAKRVRGGNRATDEMGHLWLQVLPRGVEDRRMELQEAIMRHRLEKYPGDFSAQFNLGALRLARGDAPGAVAYLREAVAAQPDQPVALNTLGAAWLSMGNAGDAAGVFERALRSNPRYTNARYNLANALAEQQQWEQAAAQFRKVLEESPQDEGAGRHLRELLRIWADEAVAAGRLEEAVAHFRESLSLRQDDAALHSDLGTVLARLGRIREAVPEFETALRLDPHLDAAKHNLQAARARLGNQ